VAAYLKLNAKKNESYFLCNFSYYLKSLSYIYVRRFSFQKAVENISLMSYP